MRNKSLIFFILKFLKIPLSIWFYKLMADFFGVSIERDSWLLAYTLIISLDLAFWGPVNDIFRTKFIFLKTENGERDALEKTRSLLFYIVLISLLIVVGIVCSSNILSSIIAPDFVGEKKQLLTYMIQILSPILLVNQLTLILTSVLNSYDVFYVPEIASFITQLLTILILFVGVNYMGIYALVLSTYLGLFVLILLLMIFLLKINVNLFSPRFVYKDFLTFFSYALPLFFPYLIGQINIVYEKNLLTLLGEGSVSIIDFGKKFPEMFIGVMNSVIFAILIPNITKCFSEKKQMEFNSKFTDFIKLSLLLLGFFCVLMFFISEILFKLLYGTSSIEHTNLQKISTLNILYACSIIGVFFYVIFGVGILSMGKNKLNGLIGVSTQIGVIICNTLLLSILDIFTFPIVSGSIHILSATVMFVFIPYFHKPLILKAISKYTIYLLTCFTITHLIYKILQSSLQDYITNIIIISLSQIIIFTLLGLLFKIDEFKTLSNFIKEKIL